MVTLVIAQSCFTFNAFMRFVDTESVVGAGLLYFNAIVCGSCTAAFSVWSWCSACNSTCLRTGSSAGAHVALANLHPRCEFKHLSFSPVHSMDDPVVWPMCTFLIDACLVCNLAGAIQNLK